MPTRLGCLKPWGSPEAGICAAELNPWHLICAALLVQTQLHLGRQEMPELCVRLGAHLSGTELGIPHISPNCTVTAAECLGQHLCGLRF